MRLALILSLASPAVALPAVALPAVADVHVLLAHLDGAQVNPPTNTPGIGEAVITIDDVSGEAHVLGEYQQLVGTVTTIHLHGPWTGVPNGGILIHCQHTGGSAGSFEGSAMLDPADVADLLGLHGYVNVHSTFKQGGEIRGDLLWRPLERELRLTSSQVVPPVASPGQAMATVLLDPGERGVTIEGSYQGLAGSVTGAHLRGPASLGQEGPVLFSLTHTGGSSGSFEGSGMLGPAKFAAVLSGDAYLELETDLHPRGELRGQMRSGEVGTIYCVAAPNSTGASGELRAFGSSSVAQGDLELRARELPPGVSATFLVGAASGQALLPGSSARLCLSGGPLARFAAQTFVSDPTGRGALKVNLAALPFAPPLAVQPGETWNFQCWYRDAANPAAPSNFTSAVSVTFE